ncbi:MAG TPA: PLP-dependent transferase, partial [Isosphaeraceae bacterium]|nr:PLP-dependent transferase [Isosphaeraceae bacterium]
MSEPDLRKDSTRCARPAREVESVSRPLVPPIAMSVVYEVGSLDQVDAIYEGRAGGFVYARDGHPNGRQLAEKVAALEGAESAWVSASGMGAEAAVLLGHLGAGDRLAMAFGVYGRTARLARELERFGVEVWEFDPSRAESLAGGLDERTRVVFAETISNPLLRLVDLEGLAEAAGKVGALLVIDHTFAPGLCKPLALGADVVTHSGTKLLGGHSDLTLGLAAGGREVMERVSSVGSTFGMSGNP